MAGLLYEQGRLEQAHAHAIKANVMIGHHPFSDSKFCAKFTLISVLDALGDEPAAEGILQSMPRMIEEEKAYHQNQNFYAFTARCAFAQGNQKAAEKWLEAYTFDNPALWEIYAAFTTCRALIITGHYDSAILLLEKIFRTASALNRPPDVIEARILLAIAYWKKKRSFQNQALDHLEEAVWTAAPYGYLQMFVNDAGVLAGMLHRLLNRVKQRKEESDRPLSFVKLLYFKTREGKSAEPVIDEISGRPIKFTEQQKAVMRLLCQGKSYSEMAEALEIKYATVRFHLEAIYKKLETTNFADAVAKINAMGLLD